MKIDEFIIGSILGNKKVSNAKLDSTAYEISLHKYINKSFRNKDIHIHIL